MIESIHDFKEEKEQKRIKLKVFLFDDNMQITCVSVLSLVLVFCYCIITKGLICTNRKTSFHAFHTHLNSNSDSYSNDSNDSKGVEQSLLDDPGLKEFLAGI